MTSHKGFRNHILHTKHSSKQTLNKATPPKKSGYFDSIHYLHVSYTKVVYQYLHVYCLYSTKNILSYVHVNGYLGSSEILFVTVSIPKSSFETTYTRYWLICWNTFVHITCCFLLCILFHETIRWLSVDAKHSGGFYIHVHFEWVQKQLKISTPLP